MLIKVSGNIISELSEKIPSIIIALSELIKNSYDAGASKVTIKIDSLTKKISIVDDGCGMNLDDINVLLHISKSNKKYGRINEYGRYTQGSKGLGFLSVFKFGSKVVWKTKKQGSQGLKFSIDYDELIKLENITDYDVLIEDCNEIVKGTHIEIELSTKNLEYLKKYFSDEINYRKIVNSFLDETFTIEMDIDKVVYSSKDIPKLKEILPELQLFYVSYSSVNQQLSFYYNGVLIRQSDFQLNSDKYKVNMEIIVYHLKPYAKEKISKLFFNPRNELTPLIYINSNLFNNYDLFDPSITRPTRHEQSLPQMIGYIMLFSEDEQMAFNSDRSQFLQNELTDSIKEFLRDINIEIQKRGSEYKKYLINLDFLKSYEFYTDNLSEEDIYNNIKDDFSFKDEITFVRNGNIIIYSVFGKKVEVQIKTPNEEKVEKPKIIPARIVLKDEKKKLFVPSSQINLYDEILTATDSSGNKINHNEIIIEVDGNLLNNGILPSLLEPCTKTVVFKYLDNHTGLATARMRLEFEIRELVLSTSNAERASLFSLPLANNYSISFNNVVNRIKEQIDSLEKDKYKEIIACSLRCLFELSVDSIIKCGKYNHLNLYHKSNLEEKVEAIIQYLSSNNNFLTYIANTTSLGYRNLTNLINISDFVLAIKKSHIGVHKSSTFLSISEIEFISKKAALFLVLVNEMISNPKIS